MSVMQRASIPSLGFDALRGMTPQQLDMVDTPTEGLLAPLSVQFDLNALDPDDLSNFAEFDSLDLGGLTPGSGAAGHAAGTPAPAALPAFSVGAGPAKSARPTAATAAAAPVVAAAPLVAAATPPRARRVAGGDATNMPRSSAAKKPAKRKAATVSGSNNKSQGGGGAKATTTSTASAAATAAANRKAAAAARKRAKMPEAEQKRRNCESAKRSRLKKMQELAQAKAKNEQLEAENAALRRQLGGVRDAAYNLNLHLATTHKDCECTALSAGLQAALASASGFR